MIGSTISHYKILNLLGAGGMGEVYRAEDTTLKREVALKILPTDLASSQERLDRFQREAETLAALDHPNIVTIHTVEEADDVHFLTMQLIEGQPLSQLISGVGMPVERIFDLVIPLADALATAHEKGVVHRDLKPANIMVTDKGQVKILDFGLTKLRQATEAALASELPTEPLTDEGKIVGTLPYMSPEQLEGKEIDGRSDIFSLGVVLYEIATGERPFKGDSSASLITAIMSHSPCEVDSLRVELPHHLSRIIRHCLEKEPTRRYQSALDVRNELQDLHREESLSAAVPVTPEPEPAPTPKPVRWPMVAAPAIVLIALLALWLGRSQPRTEVLGEPAAAVEAQPPMIVVLPFENLGDPEDEYFADGMTEEITSRLAVARGLRVISRTSAMQYKKNRPPMKQIGEELGVDFVLEGTVRWARTEGGSRVRITPQLIQVSDDTHLWAETYDRVIEDIFEVQSGIASEVVRALGVMLQGDEQQVLEERPTDSIEAYQAYLRALEPLRSTLLAWDSDEQIVEQLERAVELDPGFAEAWALLCRHHAHLFVRDLDRTEARAMRAKEALEGAERADADSLKTRVARAAFYYNVIGETEQARRELEALVERYPNDRDVLTWMANIYSDRAQMDELRLVLQRIAELDPYDLSNLLFLARCYQGLRLTEETLATCDRMIEIEPTQSGGYKCKARAIRRMKGDLEAADAILRQAPDTDSFAVTYGWIFQRQWERRWDDVIELSYSLPSDNSTLASEAVAWRAAAKYFRDGKDAAHQEIEEALRNVAEALETSPDNLNLHVWSAFLHSYIGEAEAALRETDIVLQQAAIEGAGSRKLIEGYVAIVYANVGREDQALDILERLLESHYLGAMTVHELRLSPDWDALRDHPRFQALLLKYG